MSLFALIKVGQNYEQWFAFEGKEGLEAAERGKWTRLMYWLDHTQRMVIQQAPELVKVKQVTREWAPVARTILFVSSSGSTPPVRP
jgi:hypothetical protein